MIISVASGKGGTGKTTVATNLALSLSAPQFFDCDVEEPNSNIFLKTKIAESEDVIALIPKIDKEKCTNCGKCSDFCMYNALAVLPNDVLVFPELCHSCRGCKIICPTGAIDWEQRAIGKIEHGMVKQLDFYHGLLNIGESMATPVIKELKKRIDKKRNVIIDAPPGNACPMIETISGSDYCILVTEPTLFGLHDLKLAVNVVRHLYIPFGVIINREGIGDNKVELYCNKEKIPILMRIPNKRDIAELYSKGLPFYNRIDDWEQKFKELFQRISEGVKK